MKLFIVLTFEMITETTQIRSLHTMVIGADNIHTTGSEWPLQITILTGDPFSCDMFVRNRSMRYWTPERTFHPSSQYFTNSFHDLHQADKCENGLLGTDTFTLSEFWTQIHYVLLVN